MHSRRYIGGKVYIGHCESRITVYYKDECKLTVVLNPPLTHKLEIEGD